MAAPLTPEEMARFNAQFGLGQPMGPVAFQPAPLGPPTATPMEALKPTAAEQAAMPQSATLSLPAGVGAASTAGPLTLKPGQQIDTAPDMPIAPAPQLQKPKGLDLSPIAAAMNQSGQGSQLSYPPARFVPGQWVGKSRVIEGAQHASDEAKFDENAGITLQQDAAGVRSESGQRNGAKEGALLDIVGDDLANQAAQVNARRAREAMQFQDAQNKYRDAVQRAADQGDVDPGRFWANRGTGPQMMAIIGVALGAAGAALTGGPNSAAQMIEAAIDRDMQAQRDNIAKAQGNVAASKGVLAEMRERFGDERQADIAAKDAALGVAETRIKSILADAKSDEAKARGMEMIGQLQQMRGQLREHHDVMEEGKIKTMEAYAPGHMVGGPPANGTAAKQTEDDRNVVAPDGTVYQMPTAKEGAEMRKRVAYVGEMHKIADEVDKLRDRPLNLLGNTETTADLKRLRTDYMLAYQHAHGIQRLTDKDIEVIDEAIGNPTELTSRSGRRFKGAADAAEHGVTLALRASGARVVSTGYGTDQNGNVVPTQDYTGKTVASANVPQGFVAADGSQPRRFTPPAAKQYDTSRRVITAPKGGKKGRKGGGSAAQSDPDYVSPADEGDDE